MVSCDECWYIGSGQHAPDCKAGTIERLSKIVDQQAKQIEQLRQRLASHPESDSYEENAK